MVQFQSDLKIALASIPRGRNDAVLRSLTLHGRMDPEYPLSFASEHDPLVSVRGYLKHHPLRNFSARDLGDVIGRARHALRSIQRRTMLVTAFG